MTVKVGINGFGRIGRLFFRAAMKNRNIQIVGINDITNAKTLAHLLKYDSVHGVLNAKVAAGDGFIMVNNKKIPIFAMTDPAKLPWKKVKAEYVLESTGFFRDRAGAGKHLTAGAKRVVISAPAVEPDATFVLGVNEDTYDPRKHKIVSNASCTTNCLAPVAKVLNDKWGIKGGIMTTIHSYTNDQRILDLPHKDLRRARAAGVSMIPTTTGAARAIALVIPELTGKLDGGAIRVPTPNVSLVDLTVTLEKDTTEEQINKAMANAAKSKRLKGILEYVEGPLVSIDFNGSTYSSSFDSLSTKVLGGNMVKVLSWYDNETGYANRCMDLIIYMSKKK